MLNQKSLVNLAAEVESTIGSTTQKESTTENNATEKNVEQALALRTQVRESFAKVTLSLMNLPRYRSQSIEDLNHLVFNPLIRNRIAFAYPKENKNPIDGMTGLAIWASVSAEVDAKIREQIAAGVFPVKLKAEDWTSGEVNWLFDVIAPSKTLTSKVIRNLKQVIKGGDLNIHPLVAKLVDESALEAMGAKRQSKSVPEEAPDVATNSVDGGIDPIKH
ncbi:toxin-activating lysine-acyltransferase [Marinomonas sp. 15G1-11]|uniref:RTX toxin-activating lysine-acyltransferase n=1 Tax=Marinomonas phaeophyticola TaxID=3004091 RepID=A0ABT4JS49_9GAMM|nr:toxin-activating lysine-acyltransferase [Marinomonas sp. 15G1-11]MCZ2720419.1 toxin-activating lysine-acyltransferase [Marinomonas sp. 15G1-11]